jgi:hypothetical protein
MPNEEQALATYNEANEERRFLLRQQWQVTNYTLIAFAALAAAPTWLGRPYSWASWGAFGLVSLAAASAGLYLWRSEDSLKRQERRLGAARKHLELICKIDAEVSGEEERKPHRKIKKVFLAVLFLGWAIATAIILSRST